MFNGHFPILNSCSPFSEVGVIVGIIVGVVGVLVVLGVAILLCRLFCCKQASGEYTMSTRLPKDLYIHTHTHTYVHAFTRSSSSSIPLHRPDVRPPRTPLFPWLHTRTDPGLPVTRSIQPIRKLINTPREKPEEWLLRFSHKRKTGGFRTENLQNK